MKLNVYLLFAAFMVCMPQISFSQTVHLQGETTVCADSKEIYQVSTSSFRWQSYVSASENRYRYPKKRVHKVSVKGGKITRYWVKSSPGQGISLGSGVKKITESWDFDDGKICVQDAKDGDGSASCERQETNANLASIVAVEVQWTGDDFSGCDASISFEEYVDITECRKEGCEEDEDGNKICTEECSQFTDGSRSTLKVCKGPEQVVSIITGSNLCAGNQAIFRLPNDYERADGFTYRWKVDGRVVSTGSADQVSVPTTGSTMRVSVKVSDGCGSDSQEYTQSFNPPISNTRFTGPSCVRPGSATYVATSGGQLTSVQSVKIGGQPVTYHFNGRNEIDFYAPNSLGYHSLNVRAIDDCGASRTMYFSFRTSYSCSGSPTCSWCSSVLTEEEEHVFKIASSIGVTESEWKRYDIPAIITKLNRAIDTQEISVNGSFNRFDETSAIYPNPAKDRAKLEFSEGITTVRIFNAVGELLTAVSVNTENSSSLNLELNNYSSGTYFVQFVRFDGQKIIKRLVVLKE